MLVIDDPAPTTGRRKNQADAQEASTYTSENEHSDSPRERHDSNEKVWGIVGKVATVLGLVGAVIAVSVSVSKMSDTVTKIDNKTDALQTGAARVEFKIDSLTERTKEIEQDVRSQHSSATSSPPAPPTRK